MDNPAFMQSVLDMLGWTLYAVYIVVFLGFCGYLAYTNLVLLHADTVFRRMMTTAPLFAIGLAVAVIYASMSTPLPPVVHLFIALLLPMIIVILGVEAKSDRYSLNTKA